MRLRHLLRGKAEQAYKHGFCRGRSSFSNGGHPPPLAAYPGTARATPLPPYAALLQVALARFTPLARVRHCGAGLASRRRGVTPYLALWSPDFPRRLAPTRTSSLLGIVSLPAFGRILVRAHGTRDLVDEPTCPTHLLSDGIPRQFSVIAKELVAGIHASELTHVLAQLRDVEKAAPEVGATPLHDHDSPSGEPRVRAGQLTVTQHHR